MNEKYDKLIALIKSYKGVAVAFSGGVDSTLLLAAAHRALGDRALGGIGRSPSYPKRELEAAVALAEKVGAKYKIVDTDEMSNEDYASNPPNRCYHCKSTLFGIVIMPLTTEGGWYLRNGIFILPVSSFFLIALLIWLLRTVDPLQQEKE